MQSIRSSQGLLHYEANHQALTGRPLILIHGAGGSHEDWPATLRQSDQLPVLALDLPGHGRSPGPGRATVEAYADCMLAFMDTLSIEKADLAGHSMGGAIAQQIALSHPERVDRMILVATGARLAVNAQIISQILTDTQALITRVAHWMWHPDSPAEMIEFSIRQMLATEASVIQNDYIACDTFDTRDRLQDIQALTLVIGAEKDKMVPINRSEQLAEKIPRASLLRYSDAGHMLPLEQGAWLTEAITGWLLGKS